MKARKLTLRKEMLLGLSLLLILAGVFEFIGHLQMNTVAQKAAYARQVNRCEQLFAAVDRTSPVNPATGKASADWKKAKDAFLASVNTLSQAQWLSASDKVNVANIQKAWQSYESTLSHRTPAGAVAVRSVMERTIDQVGKGSEANLKQALAGTDFGLRIAVLCGSLLGVGIVLLIAKDIRSRFEEIRHQLQGITQSQSVQAQAKATSEDDLKLQAEQLTKAVAELNNFIGQSITEKSQVEEEQVQEEQEEKVGTLK